MSLTLKPYPEYKESGQGWLARIPADWNIVPAFAAFKERQEKNVGLSEKQVLSLSYGRIIRKHDDALHGLVPASFEGYQIVEPGNLILRFTDLQNDQRSLRVGLVKDRGIITSAYVGLSVRDRLLPEYAYYLLHAADVQKVFYGMGSGLRQSLGFSDLRRMPVVVPDIDEQKRIVRFLVVTGLRTDKLIRAKRRMIELLSEQKKAIIQRAVTRGLNSKGRMKPSGIEWLPEIPEHWSTTYLKFECSHIVDCLHATPTYVPDGQFPAIRTADIQPGKVLLSRVRHISADQYAQWTSRLAPRAGDIMYSREGERYGIAALVPDGVQLCISQRMMLLRMRGSQCSEYFMWQLNCPHVYAQAASDIIGATAPHVNVERVRNYELVVPPRVEQERIVRWIAEQTAHFDDVVERAYREIAALREYRTRLIADVVTGKLDVRGVELPELKEADEIESSSDVADEELEDSEELVAADGGADAD